MTFVPITAKNSASGLKGFLQLSWMDKNMELLSLEGDTVSFLDAHCSDYISWLDLHKRSFAVLHLYSKISKEIRK